MRLQVRLAIVAFVSLLAGPSWGAFERLELAPRNMALGRAGGAYEDAVASSLVNVAAPERSSWLALAYTNPFGVEGLAEQSVRAARVWTETIATRIGWQRFGNALYAEDTASIAARLGNERASVGVRGVYRTRRTSRFAGASALSADVGIRWRSPGQVTFGVSARHLGDRTFFDATELRAGARIDVAPDATLLADVRRVGARTGIAVGLEWRPHPWLTLRGGTHNEPWQWAGGFTVRWDSISFDYALETHPALETTHVVGIVLGGR